MPNLAPSRAGAVDQELREERHGAARRPLRRAALPGGARDVEVRPRIVFREARQEARGRHAAGRAPADVREIREVRLQLILILVVERQAPRRIARFARRVEQLARERVVLREEAGVVVAERDDARARQRRDVDHGGRLEALRVRERVAQDEAALRVGVEHLDRQALHARDDVARLVRVAGRHVLAGRHDRDDVDLQAHFGDRAHRAEHRARAAHVVLHLVHSLARLQRNAAGVERDALADEHDGRRLRGRAPVLQHDELRRLDRALRDRQERAHLERLDLLQAQHVDFQAPVLRDLLRGVREVGRRADVAGQIAEVAREVHPVRERDRLLRGDLRRLVVGRIDAEHDALERRRARVRLALHLRELVRFIAQRENRRAHAPVGRALGHGQLRERERDLNHFRAEQRAPCGLCRVAVGFLAESILPAQADEQHARCADARNLVQKQGLAELAVDVARLDHARDEPLRGFVDVERRAGQGLRLEHAQHDAVGFPRQEPVRRAFAPITAFYAKVHRACPRIKSGLRMKAAIIRYFSRAA
ncbi:hypothetical protein BURPS1710b_1175 [Burkholderia pseudomallei 1710b]|uniref:Uncharacterized protein n=1 Tax=Burkholderia pseudomallei (strain 1710b) TaxID=320372 RepID=Q3JV17_BURP1|nr:hypothetical protein BURPS1710b_1175 [Burkholderia pseudomallei 1710b]